ncbi:MAG: 4Fe-4S dicluster domain-containing protein [Aigarchaeota archaeon]|nr:4Fe-4S dicluster domain-containing protein [Candidatus Wolframiiraptor gerlachensis]
MTTRRELFRMMLGLLFIPLAGGFLSMLPGGRVVRPPGAVDERLFLELCTRCGICVKACSSEGRGTLEPCGLLDGVSMMGTPKVNPLRAPCESRYGMCEGRLPCVRSCPTGALRWIEPEEIKLGSVSWSPDRCIAVLGGECLVCAEVCPAPGAITPRNGIPVFHSNRCVGCGRCVYACPADPKALNLMPEGERRHHWDRAGFSR